MSLVFLFKSPWLEALVYTLGMLLVTAGIGLLIAITDAGQFSVETCYTLIAVAISFIVIGFAVITVSCRIPTDRSVLPKFTVRMRKTSASSMAEMLDDVRSVGSGDSSVVELHDINSAQRAAEVVRNCMMFQNLLQPRSSGSCTSFKETSV